VQPKAGVCFSLPKIRRYNINAHTSFRLLPPNDRMLRPNHGLLVANDRLVAANECHLCFVLTKSWLVIFPGVLFVCEMPADS
jgi:hypothetical protein